MMIFRAIKNTQPFRFMARFSKQKDKDGIQEEHPFGIDMKQINTRFKGNQQKIRQKTPEQLMMEAKVEKKVEIQQKYEDRSAKLFDRYLQERAKPQISLDNYQIHYSLVLERLPIFYPYDIKTFQYYKNRYSMSKKTGRYPSMPKQLQLQKINTGGGLSDKNNPQNQISYVKVINADQKEIYCQNSRNWRLTDPDIIDEKSIQTYSSDVVFFIVKDKNNEWSFPSRAISQMESHKDFFEIFLKEIFAGSKNPKAYFGHMKPRLVTKNDIDNLEKGKGHKKFFFKGITINGIAKFPTPLFQDYAWVPKAHLSKYFKDHYFKQVIRTVSHIF